MDLTALGFLPEELHRCSVVDRRMLVSADLAGTPVRFLVDLGASAAVELSLSFLEQRGQYIDSLRKVPARSPGASAFRIGTVSSAGELEVLGERHDLAFAEASELYRFDSLTEKSGGGPPIAGSLGADFFRDGVLALDLAEERLGFSRRPKLSANLPPAEHVLKLCNEPGGGPPIADTLQNGLTESVVWMYFDTGVQSTALSHRALQRRLSGRGVANWFLRWALRRHFRRGSEVPTDFYFPDGHRWSVRVSLVASLDRMAIGYGHEAIDGWIGMDLCERWASVFDFSGGRLCLYS